MVCTEKVFNVDIVVPPDEKQGQETIEWDSNQQDKITEVCRGSYNGDENKGRKDQSL